MMVGLEYYYLLKRLLVILSLQWWNNNRGSSSIAIKTKFGLFTYNQMINRSQMTTCLEYGHLVQSRAVAIVRKMTSLLGKIHVIAPTSSKKNLNILVNEFPSCWRHPLQTNLHNLTIRSKQCPRFLSHFDFKTHEHTNVSPTASELGKWEHQRSMKMQIQPSMTYFLIIIVLNSNAVSWVLHIESFGHCTSVFVWIWLIICQIMR